MERSEETSFGTRHFGTAALGDIRRTRRLAQLADAFLRQPEASLPRKCGSAANYQALLGLLDCPDVTHAAVIEAHCQRTRRTLGPCAQPVTLLVGDITELDFTSRRALKDQLGPIGNGRGFGYECFNLLAIDPQRRAVIGLVNQLLFRRRRRKIPRSRASRLPAEERQSGLWVRATRDLPAVPGPTRVVRVFDREGDTDEVLRAPGEYLIRSRTDRRILAGSGPDAPEGKLHALLRTLPSQGTREVVVEPSPTRAGRVARCGVSFAGVQIRWSKPNGSPDGDPTCAFGVRVWELEPPAGEDGLEWLLLTNVAVGNVPEAQARVDWYECRWLVEEYHKALKSGVGIESAQLTRRERLEPLIGMLSVVALELLWVRDAARDPSLADRPAEEVVDEVLVEVLSHAVPGPAGPAERMTVRTFYRAVARLGGYMGNFRKKPPGWPVLWHGWVRLNTMAQGVMMIRNQRNL
jgi:hypothetical protein